MVTSYTQKLIKCGEISEMYQYSKEVFRGLESRIYGARGKNLEPKPRTAQSALRTRKKIRQLVNSNPTLDKFLTLTFAENVQDIKLANYEFKKFRQKLEYELGRKFKYLGVIEFQKRGAIHYHLMLDIPFIKWQKLSEIWGNGRIQIERIKKPNRAGFYMAKTTGYLMKNTEDTRLFGKKVFFYATKIMEKAVEKIYKFFTIDNIPPKLIEIFSRRFFAQGLGMVKYTLFAPA